MPCMHGEYVPGFAIRARKCPEKKRIYVEAKNSLRDWSYC